MKEQRLIDANAFEEKMKKTSRYFSVVHDIREMPTIDPETLPIVNELRAKLSQYEREAEHWKECYVKVVNERWKQHHAHWEINKSMSSAYDTVFKCSACGKEISVNGIWELNKFIEKYPYCSCGAKMDE